MTTTFEINQQGNQNNPVKSGLKSERGSKETARNLSKEGATVILFAIENQQRVKAWEFVEGKLNRTQEIGEKQAAPVEEETTDEELPSSEIEAATVKPATTVEKAAPTVSGLHWKNISSDQLEFNEGSNRRKVWDILLSRGGSAASKDVTDALYADKEVLNPRAAMSMVVKGINIELGHHDADYKVVTKGKGDGALLMIVEKA